MNALEPRSQFQFPWFGVCLGGIWLFALGLRFWGLERFNTLVFDEVYYAKFAHQYLSQQPFFDGHPPLSKYLIAIGMWLGEQLPWGQGEKNGLTGGLYSPWSYRWLNAVTGSFIPLAIAGIAHRLLRCRSFTLMAAGLAALDGLLLVESRYALNNVYLLLFGLLGWWAVLVALDGQAIAQTGGESKVLRRAAWLILAGMGFGASVAIKWNGLWFLLGFYGLWGVAQGLQWGDRRFYRRQRTELPDLDAAIQTAPPNPLQRLHTIRWWQLGTYFGVIPFVTYALTWIPHLQLNAKGGFWTDFWTLQAEILGYHSRVGSGPAVHPYCSPWYSWLVMWRPVAYFYRVTGKNDPLPTEQVLPTTTTDPVIYDVHAIGNPILWWLALIAIALVLGILLQLVIQTVWTLRSPKSSQIRRSPSQTLMAIAADWGLTPAEVWVMLFLAVNYGAQLLPWVRVTRCVFLYHYMGAYLFTSLALAWLLNRWLRGDRAYLRYISIGAMILMIVAFFYWLPIYLGLPITPNEFKQLLWFKSWI